MKSRKQRAFQPRKGNNVPEEQQQSRSIIKHPSAHTKISTNCTVHSSVARPTIDKKPKSKKNNKANVKQQGLQPAASTSKSRRKPGLAIDLRQEELNLQLPEPSWREYCLVDGDFLPITDSKQQQMLSELFSQTASSSCDAHGFGVKTDKVDAVGRAKPKQLRKKSNSSVIMSKSSTDEEEGIIRHEIGVETTKREKELVSAEVEAVIEKCQIGMQYSQRKNQIEQRQQQDKELVVQDEKSDNILQDYSSNKQTITDLFFKLEFSHLGDEKAFAFLSSQEKTHFTQLLQTLITKMTPQSHKPQLKPISFQEIEDRPDCITEQSELYASPNQNSPRNKPDCLLKETANQKLEQLICLREYRQLNLVEDLESYNDEAKVNTSLMSILNFLGHLFCYIEVHYSQQFVYMIRKMYGHTFKEKYKRITRGIPLSQDRRFRVVDEALFEDFMNENDIGDYNYNEALHLKAVFDAFNEHLEEYRPYFLGNGEQFPWAFKMFMTMSEYSIDEDSLQIIFRQAKDKIVQWSTLFCGILIDKDEIVLTPKNPLELKHTERQNKMIVSWINEQNFQKDGVELFGTQTLHEAAELIYKQLMEEFVREGGFIFN